MPCNLDIVKTRWGMRQVGQSRASWLMWHGQDRPYPTQILSPQWILPHYGSHWDETSWLARDCWSVPKSVCNQSPEILLETSSSSLTALKWGFVMSPRPVWQLTGTTSAAVKWPWYFGRPWVSHSLHYYFFKSLEQVIQHLWISFSITHDTHLEGSVKRQWEPESSFTICSGQPGMPPFFLPHFDSSPLAACLWRNKT